MVSSLDALKAATVIVADTGNVQAIAEHQPRDATTNPSLILAAAKLSQYAPIINGAIAKAKAVVGADATSAAVVTEAIDQVSVAFGLEILKIVPGRVSTEVDARLSYNTEGSIAKGRKLIGLYADAGISKERFLIKVAATWEGIKAAEILEKEGIHCNLTLMFGMAQAVACGDAKVTLISPFVGRIFDWFKKHDGVEGYEGAEDPGVKFVTLVFNYYKTYGVTTEVMGASFRNVQQLIELAGCDLLTVSPALLSELSKLQDPVPKKLSAENAKAASLAKIEVDEESYKTLLASDQMATDKLSEGIDGFSKAIVSLEQILGEILAGVSVSGSSSLVGPISS